MSLVSYIQRPEVAARIKPFRPPPPRKINAPLKVEPRTDHWSLVGTAFDYILRFELKRRAPYARDGMWTAEATYVLVSNLHLSPNLRQQVQASGLKEDALVEFCDDVVSEAKEVYSTFVKTPSPTPTQLAIIAGHAIRLARLDPIFRTRRIDETFVEDPDPADVEDLMELLAVVPFEDLMHGTNLLLNPSFGESSRIVSGADVDLISGDRLIDFKTTKKTAMEVLYLDQIFGWFLLARRERRLNSKFPEVNKLGLYFCRHGHLWLREASEWTSKPGFQQLEEWFYDHAREVYSQRSASTQ
jgi:hypothetical protein